MFGISKQKELVDIFSTVFPPQKLEYSTEIRFFECPKINFVQKLSKKLQRFLQENQAYC